MTMGIELLVGLVAGVVLWTLLEYVMHRFAGHSNRLGKHVRKEHFAHHATPDYFTSLPKKLLLAVPVLSVIATIGALAFGAAGVAIAIGTGVGWTFYERLHRATHVRGPQNAYGDWARRHHLHHHFQSPKANHGVTTPIWDWVFGTLEQPATITVPRRHVRAFAWLLSDDAQTVAPRYADRYELR